MRKLSLACALALALLAGCSTMRLSYEHADWLAARMADRYVDLSERQEKTFRTGLADLHAWHRARELPHYAQMFEEAARRLERGMGRDDVRWALAQIRARVKLLGERAAAEVGASLASLDEAQLRDVQKRFEQDNRKFAREHLSEDAARVAARRTDWLCERIEDWVGDLTPAQRTRVRTLVDAFPAMPALRLEERQRRQANLLALVREGRGAADVQARLVRLLSDPDAGRGEDARRAMAQWERAFIDMLVDLDASLSAEQRSRAVQRMRGYARDFRQLASHSGAGTAQAAPLAQ